MDVVLDDDDDDDDDDGVTLAPQVRLLVLWESRNPRVKSPRTIPSTVSY